MTHTRTLAELQVSDRTYCEVFAHLLSAKAVADRYSKEDGSLDLDGLMLTRTPRTQDEKDKTEEVAHIIESFAVQACHAGGIDRMGPRDTDVAIDAITGILAEGRLNAVPLLMSYQNPTGWKLEEMLEQIITEICAKNDRLRAHMQTPQFAAEEERRKIITRFTINNNEGIIRMLRSAIDFQTNTLRNHEQLGKDPGPHGTPRIGPCTQDAYEPEPEEIKHHSV